MKKIFKYVLTMVVLVIIYITTLHITSLIPSKYLKENVKETSEILLQEGNNLIIPSKLKNIYIKYDNYTDALMINTAYSIDSNNPLESCMVCRKNYIPGTTKIIFTDTLHELKSASKYSEVDQVGELRDTVNNDIDESFEYARYWHGYLIVLRILLLLFNITEIRLLFSVILIILLAILIYLLVKKIGIHMLFIFLIGFLMVDYEYIGNSLQGCSVFFITVISSIFIILRYNKIKHFPLVFLIIGSLTNFFDFLTVPILTLGVPFTVFFLLKQRKTPRIIIQTNNYMGN